MYRSDCNPKLGMQQRTCIPSVTWLWAISKSLRGIAPIHFVPNAASCSCAPLHRPRPQGRAERGRSASQSETNRMPKGVHPRKKIFGFQGSRQCRDPAEHKEDIDRWITSPCQRRRGRRKRGAVAIDELEDTWTCAEGLQARLGGRDGGRWNRNWVGWNRVEGHRVGRACNCKALAFSSDEF